MRYLVLLIVVALAGCVDTSSPKFQQMTAQKCEGFGFKEDSTELANCRMNLSLAQEQDNMRRRQNMARAFADAGDQFNENQQRQMDRNAYMMAHQQPMTTVQPIQVNSPVNCTSTSYFNQVQTHCQ